jgi:hypothetical protein
MRRRNLRCACDGGETWPKGMPDFIIKSIKSSPLTKGRPGELPFLCKRKVICICIVYLHRVDQKPGYGVVLLSDIIVLG